MHSIGRALPALVLTAGLLIDQIATASMIQFSINGTPVDGTLQEVGPQLLTIDIYLTPDGPFESFWVEFFATGSWVDPEPLPKIGSYSDQTALIDSGDVRMLGSWDNVDAAAYWDANFGVWAISGFLVGGPTSGPQAVAEFDVDLSSYPASTILNLEIDYGEVGSGNYPTMIPLNLHVSGGGPPPPSVQFDSGVSSGDESVTPANLSVSLSETSGSSVTVDYAVTGGTATGGGVDFTLAAGQLQFDPGTVTEVIPIDIVDDALFESSETIEVTLSDPVGATLGAQTVHTYTILENDCYATRSVPTGYVPGQALTVSISADPNASTSAYAVEDAAPVGWAISNINESGQFDPNNLKVKWGPFFDSQSRILTYEATPPIGESGEHCFAGVISMDGVNYAICGDECIEPCPCHPADDPNCDHRMEIAEVTGYGAAWRVGDIWPVPPNPIPIDYVTRAAYLWLNGELYCCDFGQAAPLMWVVCPPGAPARATAALEEAEAAQAAEASRSFELAGYVPGEALGVMVEVVPGEGASSYAVEDAPPAGWLVVQVSEGGAYDGTNGKVKWGPFFDDQPRVLGYEVVAVAGVSEVVAFSGAVSVDGRSTEIAGEAELSLLDGSAGEDGPRDGRTSAPQETPGACCGSAGPLTPLGLVLGMLLLNGFASHKEKRRC